ncbi:MAG: DUF4350 domain-containing protein [Niabella sp.]
MSTWISLSKNDKSPYGTYVFYNGLKQFFPQANIKNNTKDIYDNEYLSNDIEDELYIVITPFLRLSKYDLEYLMEYVNRGNNLFITTFDIGDAFAKEINAKAASSYTGQFPFGNVGPFNMKQTLVTPVFTVPHIYSYPGQEMEGYFNKTDTSIARTLGTGTGGNVNFVHLKSGGGNLYIHLSPMSFSNYFLLYDNNSTYFEQIFSAFPKNIKSIIWDEYMEGTSFDNNNQRKRHKPNWFSAIMSIPAFRAGILTALFVLLLYTLIEMRRKQRVIPVINAPVNDSLEFVKTMGLLYYQRSDHQNLAHKMSTYFLDHLNGRYRIFAKELNADFVKEVSHKSGVNEPLVASIVQQMRLINSGEAISDIELIALQRNMEEFYNRE